ncbi:MAG: DUF2267 domain-containing protein [Anaerolineae bacterium]|jgi:uncharacterized protein (DUF2267 family)
MRRDEFVERVQERTGLSAEEAERAVDAVLETLGERLELTEKNHLASQVGSDLKEPLLRRKRTERYSLEEFYNRVGGRSEVSFAHAENHTRAVMEVLREAIAPGELQHIIEKLPDEYRDLLRTE